MRPRYEDCGSLANVLCLCQIDASSGAPRQADCEFGECTDLAVHGDRAAVTHWLRSRAFGGIRTIGTTSGCRLPFSAILLRF